MVKWRSGLGRIVSPDATTPILRSESMDLAQSERRRVAGTLDGEGPVEIAKAGSVMRLPVRGISMKNDHLWSIDAIATRGFTAVVSVFGGTPPAKPLFCKIGLNRFGAVLAGAWTHATG